MRYILIILVFISVGVKAQMVIKAHPNYVPLARNPVLDDYSGAYVGYGVRKLRTAYTGNAIRVRKDTTGQPEQDIGFTASGDLDTAALKSFLNARSGFITIWYDQSGNGRSATMTVQANQPRIALLGVIERRSGDIAIRFDGTNDYLLAAGTSAITISPTSFYAISSRSSTSNTRRTVFSTGINVAGGRGYGSWYRNSTDGFQDSVGIQVVYQTGFGNTGTYTNTIDQNNLLFAVTTTGNDNTWFNGGRNITSTYTATNGNTTTPIAIGARTADNAGGSPTFYMNGTVTELVIWQSNQTSNRTGIESNINSYYLIY